MGGQPGLHRARDHRARLVRESDRPADRVPVRAEKRRRRDTGLGLRMYPGDDASSTHASDQDAEGAGAQCGRLGVPTAVGGLLLYGIAFVRREGSDDQLGEAAGTRTGR